MSAEAPDWADVLRGALSREVTPHRQAMRRSGDVVRVLIEKLLATTAPMEALEDVVDDIEALCRRLDEYPGGRTPEGFGESANSGDPHAFFDMSPEIGRANPIAPPMHMTIDDHVVVGRVRFGSAYEGPPGCVHGGHVAAAFDEVLGMAQSLTGRPGMTGTLTVKYRNPTPLHVDLRFEGQVDRVEGRTIFTVGRSFHDDVVTAEAEAVFITVDFARIAELYDRRRRP